MKKLLSIFLAVCAMLTLLSATALAADTGSVADGVYFVQSALPGNYVLDVPGSSTESAQGVNLWTWNGGGNQRVWIHSIGNGRYSIDFAHSGQVLNIYGNSRSSGARIIQYPWTGETCEQWAIIHNGDGTVSFEANGLYLDAEGAVSKGYDGCPLIGYAPNGGVNQKWRLISVNDVPRPNPDGAVSDRQRAMANAAERMIGKSGYSGFCQKFVRVVGESIGLPGGGAGSALEACGWWRVSASADNIPVGAALYLRSKNTSGAGYRYGHVGVYVGDGQVVHASSVIRKDSLARLLRSYDYLGWGWQAGVDLR